MKSRPNAPQPAARLFAKRRQVGRPEAGGECLAMEEWRDERVDRLLGSRDVADNGWMPAADPRQGFQIRSTAWPHDARPGPPPIGK